jgi:hypothetical protein
MCADVIKDKQNCSIPHCSVAETYILQQSRATHEEKDNDGHLRHVPGHGYQIHRYNQQNRAIPQLSTTTIHELAIN